MCKPAGSETEAIPSRAEHFELKSVFLSVWSLHVLVVYAWVLSGLLRLPPTVQTHADWSEVDWRL